MSRLLLSSLRPKQRLSIAAWQVLVAVPARHSAQRARRGVRLRAPGGSAAAPAELAVLCARVIRLGDATGFGLTAFLDTGAEIDWFDDVSLFVSPTARERDRPALEYGVTQGPPLGDEEIEGEVTGEITWFLNEDIFNFWLFTSDEPRRARMWNHDGGIAADEHRRSPTQVLAARLCELSRR